MKQLAAEFKEFLLKQNALALAVGVIIGGALGKIVSGLVDDLIMPIVGLALPGGDWRSAQLRSAAPPPSSTATCSGAPSGAGVGWV